MPRISAAEEMALDNVAPDWRDMAQSAQLALLAIVQAKANMPEDEKEIQAFNPTALEINYVYLQFKNQGFDKDWLNQKSLQGRFNWTAKLQALRNARDRLRELKPSLYTVADSEADADARGGGANEEDLGDEEPDEPVQE